MVAAAVGLLSERRQWKAAANGGAILEGVGINEEKKCYPAGSISPI